MPGAMLDGPITEIEIRRHPDSGPRSNERFGQGPERIGRRTESSPGRKHILASGWVGRPGAGQRSPHERLDAADDGHHSRCSGGTTVIGPVRYDREVRSALPP